MKRNMKKPLVFIMALMMMIMTVLPVSASQATSYTYTLDDNNERVRTQDAYLPDRTITNLVHLRYRKYKNCNIRFKFREGFTYNLR